MTPFQIFGVGFLALLILGEIFLQVKGLTRTRVSLARTATWILAIVFISQPYLVQWMAVQFRVGRGADLLLYFVAIAFVVATFVFAHVLERHRIQITKLVRELAVREPMFTPNSSYPERDEPLDR